MKDKRHVTSVSEGRLGGMFCLNRSDSNFGWSAFSRNRSDPAAHAKHKRNLI